MIRVYLSDDYYVDQDRFNFILKHSVETKDKEGNLTGKNRDYVIGYYRHMDDVIESYLEDNARNVTDDSAKDMRGYIETLRSIFAKAVDKVKTSVKTVYIEDRPEGWRKDDNEGYNYMD